MNCKKVNKVKKQIDWLSHLDKEQWHTMDRMINDLIKINKISIYNASRIKKLTKNNKIMQEKLTDLTIESHACKGQIIIFFSFSSFINFFYFYTDKK